MSNSRTARRLHPGRFMIRAQVLSIILLALLAIPAWAQTPAPKEPTPLWDVQVGASFVGTTGNSETSSTGADFLLHRRWRVWQIESTATAVRTSDPDVLTAERYLGM